MMRLARRVLLLVALSLPASATAVYAECAWVLWQRDRPVEGSGGVLANPRGIGPETYRWGVIAGVATEQECIAGRVEAYRQMEKTPPDQLALGELFGLVHYICLPDTVDPRGPKGK